MEVVPAGDHDEVETAQMHAAINSAPTAATNSGSVSAHGKC